jgi:hypothetical protein
MAARDASGVFSVHGVAIPQPCQTADLGKVDDRGAHPGHPNSLSGVSRASFAALKPLVQPVQHFRLNPSHPVLAKVYPQGELPDLLQPRDVLG